MSLDLGQEYGPPGHVGGTANPATLAAAGDQLTLQLRLRADTCPVSNNFKIDVTVNDTDVLR